MTLLLAWAEELVESVSTGVSLTCHLEGHFDHWFILLKMPLEPVFGQFLDVGQRSEHVVISVHAFVLGDFLS